ncbi:LacI family DNA-binding transcriptional regulator [Saccharopolyspora griseoalba]|uniref:LacI family DNA-binding transcriptional regulator n=1 Tax=Saccharopolyspora griseoalba TaxID=1431848 RepID=A0ABW2LH89_9PSEU
MSATMRDVARLAGVSVRTVSNVVNEFPHVSSTTRGRVLAAIAELGYQVNYSARSLGRTGMLALAVPELRTPHFAELSDEIVGAAAERGYTVLVEQTGGVRDRELSVLSSHRRRMTDGLIFSPLALGRADGPRLDVSYPLVLLGGRPIGGPVHHVATADQRGGRAVGEHLLARGARRIAVIGSALEGGAGHFRALGFLEALREAGLDHDPARTGEAREWTRETGAAAMRRLLDSGVPVDAVFGLDDVLALGALRVLHERGLRVPDDVAVAGFDDIDDGRYARPNLTTVRPGRTEIARTAVDLLLDRVSGAEPRAQRQLIVEHELVVRESTGSAW